MREQHEGVHPGPLHFLPPYNCKSPTITLPIVVIQEEISIGVTLKYGHGTQTATSRDKNHIGELNVAIGLPGAGGWFTMSYMKP